METNNNNNRQTGYVQLFTEKQVAEMLNVSVKTIQAWRYLGKMSYQKINGCVRYTQEDIDAVISRRNG